MTTEKSPPESQPKQGTKLTLKEAVALAKKISRKAFIEQAENLAEDEDIAALREELAAVKAERDELLEVNETQSHNIGVYQEIEEKLKAERDRMRDALEWFSATRNYIYQSGMSPADKTPAVYREGRLRARAALSPPAPDESEKAGGA